MTRVKFWNCPMYNMSGQSGNVFAIILVAVILFAALMFVFSRGMDIGVTRITSVSARAHAVDTITYAQNVERAVQKLIQNGVSESDISFENATVTGYAHTPVAVDTEKLFNSNMGGGLNWKNPTTDQTPLATNKWLFTGDIIVTGQESNSRSELLMTLPVTPEVCTEINKQLNTGIDLSGTIGTVTGAKFIGTYLDNVAIVIAPGVGLISGCVRGLITDGTQTGDYTFFKVLLAR